MKDYLNEDMLRLLVASVSFLALLVLVYLVYRFFFSRLKRRVLRLNKVYSNQVVELFNIPALWLIYCILFKIFSHIYLSNLFIFPYLLHARSEEHTSELQSRQ